MLDKQLLIDAYKKTIKTRLLLIPEKGYNRELALHDIAVMEQKIAELQRELLD